MDYDFNSGKRSVELSPEGQAMQYLLLKPKYPRMSLQVKLHSGPSLWERIVRFFCS